ncbi:MAG: HupE/UreJ family protein [Pirellula sp.]|jgi:urease accessory protein
MLDIGGTWMKKDYSASEMWIAMYSTYLRLMIFLWLVLVSGNCVFAHGDGDISGGFASGISHPIRGMDHVVAMLAVGLWGAQLGAPAIWVLPIAFPLVMAFGAAMSLMGFPLPGVEIGIAFSAFVLGLMVLLESRPPLAVSLSLVAAFALFHGHAHGGELPHGESGLAYSLGFVLGTGLLHAVGIGIGCIGHWSWGKVCLRASGALVMLSGVYFLISSLGYFA